MTNEMVVFKNNIFKNLLIKIKKIFKIENYKGFKVTKFEYKKLQEEYAFLLNEYKNKQKELSNIKIKNLKIALKIYQNEEKFLYDIKKMKAEELEEVRSNYNEFIKVKG